MARCHDSAGAVCSGFGIVGHAPHVSRKCPHNSLNSLTNRVMLRTASTPRDGMHYERLVRWVFRNGFATRVVVKKTPTERWANRFPAARRLVLLREYYRYGRRPRYKVKTFIKIELINKYFRGRVPILAARAIQNPDAATTTYFGRWYHALGNQLKSDWNSDGPIFYTSGANARQLGDWFVRATGHFKNFVIYEIDCSRWDGHYGLDCAVAATLHNSLYGAPDDVLSFEMPVRNKIFDPTTGLIIDTVPIRLSGVPQTSCDSSKGNAYTATDAIDTAQPLVDEVDPPFRMAVLGDDNIAVLDASHPVTLAHFEAAYKKVGHSPKAKCVKRPLEATYCSGRFYLVDEVNRVWAPKVGRALCKMGWQVRKDLHPDEWLRSTAVSWAQDTTHVPVLRAITARMAVWANAAGPPMKCLEHRPHSDRAYPMPVAGLLEFCDLYGLTPEDVDAVEEYLSNANRGDMLRHWILDKIIAVDVEDSGPTTAAALSLAPLPAVYDAAPSAPEWAVDYRAYDDAYQRYTSRFRKPMSEHDYIKWDLENYTAYRRAFAKLPQLGFTTCLRRTRAPPEDAPAGEIPDSTKQEMADVVVKVAEKKEGRAKSNSNNSGRGAKKPNGDGAAKRMAQRSRAGTVEVDVIAGNARRGRSAAPAPVGFATGAPRRTASAPAGRRVRHPNFTATYSHDVAGLLEMFSCPMVAAPIRYSDKSARPTVVAVPFFQEPMLPSAEDSGTQGATSLTDPDWMCGFVFRDPRRAAVLKQKPNGQFIYNFYYGQAAPTQIPPPFAVGQNMVPDILVSVGSFKAHGDFLPIGFVTGGPDNGRVVWIDSPLSGGAETAIVMSGLAATILYTIRCTRYLNGGQETFAISGTSDGAGNLSINFPVGKPGYYNLQFMAGTTFTNAVRISIQGTCETWSHRMLPYLANEATNVESLRILAADLMYSNVAPKEYRAGVASTYQAAGDDDWTRYAFGGQGLPAFQPGVNGMATILGCKGAQRFDTDEGVHNWVRPAGDDSFAAYDVGPRSVGLSLGRIPEPYDIEADVDYTMVAYSIPKSAGTPSGRPGYWTCAWAVEYETESPWRDQEVPDVHPAAWDEAVFQSGRVPGGTTNKSHLARLWGAATAVARFIPRAARAVAPFLSPGLSQVAQAAGSM